MGRHAPRRGSLAGEEKVIRTCTLVALQLAGAGFLLTAAWQIWQVGTEARGVIRETSQVVRAAETAIQRTDKFLNEDPRGLQGVFSNTNAVLLQLGLASDQWRRASMEQRKLLVQNQREARESIQKATETLDELRAAAKSITTLVTNSDASLNKGLLPEATKAVVSINSATASLETKIGTLLDESTRTMNKAGAVLGNPELVGLAENLNDTSAELQASAANVEQATGYIKEYLRPTKQTFWKALLKSMIPRAIVRISSRWFLGL